MQVGYSSLEYVSECYLQLLTYYDITEIRFKNGFHTIQFLFCGLHVKVQVYVELNRCLFMQILNQLRPCAYNLFTCVVKYIRKRSLIYLEPGH